ncbi:MAG: hypothetical protein U1F76_01420 [Candidatus Competibacteraceae bacterium]
MLNRLDVLVILEEVLLVARQHGVEAAKGSKEFDQGLAMAYYDVLTVAIEQAQLLGVDLDEIGLAGFDPDKEILNARCEAISAA